MSSIPTTTINTLRMHCIFTTMRLFILLLLVLIYSCNKSDHNNYGPVFKYNEHAGVTSLDPAFAKDQRNMWVCNQLYNTLVKLDKDLNVIPDLAKSWNIDSTATNYTFILRNDSYFYYPNQDKKERVKASDVAYSLNRLKDEALASPGSTIVSNIETIEVTNDSVLNIKLKQAFPAFLGLMSMQYASILSENAMEVLELNPRSQPVGTGPFYLKRWEENVKMVLRKNQYYWETDSQGNQLPYLESVAITFKPDKQSEYLEFAQGNLDFINAIDASYKDELLTSTGDLKEKHQQEITLAKAPFLNTEYLGINLKSKNPALQSKKIRTAINIGFDRGKMITYLRNNIGIPATRGFIPAGLPGSQQAPELIYNRKKARELVNAYKQESGASSVIINLATSANYLDLCEFIQKELEKIGITIQIEVMPPGTLRQLRSKGQLEMFRSSWIADYPDAQNYLSLFYSKNHTPSGSNYSFFHDDHYDALYKESIVTASVDERVILYKKMDSIINEEAPVIPLYYDESTRFYPKNIINLKADPTNILDLTSVKKLSK